MIETDFTNFTDIKRTIRIKVSSLQFQSESFDGMESATAHLMIYQKHVVVITASRQINHHI